jgi:parallel beta-helix repeat protein
MRNHVIGGFALVLAAASAPTAAEAMATTVDCSVATIAGALDAGFDEITVRGICTEDVEVRRDDITIQGNPIDGFDTIVGQVFITGAQRVTIQDLAISNSQAHGIAVVEGAAVTVARVTVDNVAGAGIIAAGGGNLHTDRVTIKNSGGGTGIVVDRGSQALIENSTILDNQEGIELLRGSVAELSGNTIKDNAEGVGLDVSSTAWLNNNTISTTASPDSAALDLVRGSTVRLNGGNTLTSNGFAIAATNGSTLIQHQHGHDKVTGRVQVTALSNAEFRNVDITGPVEVSDHSLLRMRDTSGIPGNVSVKGTMSVSQDSGLNFLKLAGDQRVKVSGNITCDDTESSISAPSTNVTITGTTKGCTGYNYVSN